MKYIVEWYVKEHGVQHLYYDDSFKAIEKLRNLSALANKYRNISHVSLQMSVR